MQSCVNLRTSGLFYYMQEIAKYVRFNPLVRGKNNNYNCMQHGWLSYLRGRVDNFVDSTCCNQISHLHLSIGVGSSERTPKLLKWDCVNNKCLECGVENKDGIYKCEILSKSTAEINVLEWVLVERQGVNKAGKSNTQQVGLCILPVGGGCDEIGHIVEHYAWTSISIWMAQSNVAYWSHHVKPWLALYPLHWLWCNVGSHGFEER